MSELYQNRDFRSLILVDRAGRGGTEFIFDGVRITFPPGVVEQGCPWFVAQWLFGVNQTRVWTKDGDFTFRFGVKNAPEEFLAAVGPEAGDTSPIEIDGNRIEGWDTTGVDRSNATVLKVSVPASDLSERQGRQGQMYGDRK